MKVNFKKNVITAISIIIALVLFVGLNLAVNCIPSSYTHFDTTTTDIFTLTDWTKSKLLSINQKVDIYFLCLNSIEDENISELLSRYSDLNEKINVTIKDTAVYPQFYLNYTDQELSDNSIIVVSGEKSYCIDFYDIYEYTDSTSNFDGEGEITCAIDYVTSENSPVLYTLEGHEETEFSDELQDYIRKENIQIKSLNLTSATSVPNDAKCILINSPQRDITSDVKTILENYLLSGGNILILYDYTQEDFPILNSFLEENSIIIEKGIVQEANSNRHYPDQPYSVIPIILPHEITNPIINADLSLLFPFAGGITIKETESADISTNVFIATEETAYSTLSPGTQTRPRENNDIAGPFALAVEVIKTTEQNEAKLIVYSTSLFLSTTADDPVGGANHDVFLNTVSYLCDSEAQSTIRAKELMSASISVPELASNILFFVLVILLPMAVILIGIIIIHIRRFK